MPKQNPPKNSPKLDMNPMVDMAFLLVSFFMLTTTFKMAEPVQIEKAHSRSNLKMPETNVITLTVTDDGRVFYAIDGKFARKKLLGFIGGQYQQEFSEEEYDRFAVLSSFGIPITGLKPFLALPPEERQHLEQPGIPCDSLHNELEDWILYSRMANPKVRIAINADKDTPYQHVQNVVNTLLANRIYRFNLVTELEKSN